MKSSMKSVVNASGLRPLAESVLDCIRLTRGALTYRSTGRTPTAAHLSLVRLFCNSSGLSSDLIASAISSLQKPAPITNASGILGNFSTGKLSEITSQIERDGYYIFEQKLSDELCDRLLEFALTSPATVRPEAGAGGGGGTIMARYDRDKPLAVRYDFSPESLLANPDIQRILADDSIIAVAQSYLRATPIADVLGMWWHTALRKQPDKDAAQFFHFDMDRIKWLKFFFYLTDCGPENGPHHFVSGTHRRRGIPSQILQKFYARLTDDEVKAHYDRSRFIEFTGKRGTIFAEDTRGLHKGRHVELGDRLVFQIQFSNSLFGATYAPARMPENVVPELRALMRARPQIFANYAPESPQSR
jgi:hypothetical protein